MKKKTGRKRKHPDSNSLSKQKPNSKNDSNSSLPTQKELNILSKDKKIIRFILIHDLVSNLFILKL